MKRLVIAVAAGGALALLASGCASDETACAKAPNPSEICYKAGPYTRLDIYGRVAEKEVCGDPIEMFYERVDSIEIFEDPEGKVKLCEMAARFWIPVTWVLPKPGSPEDSESDEFWEMLGDGNIHRLSGFERISVADLDECKHEGVEVGEIVPLDIRHEFTIDPPYILRENLKKYGSLQSKPLEESSLKPKVSDCFGRVVRLEAKVVKKPVPTTPATVFVEVAGDEPKQIECIVAEKEKDVGPEWKRVERIFAPGANLTLVGYEIPYGDIYQPWGGPADVCIVRENRRYGKTVFFVCEAEVRGEEGAVCLDDSDIKAMPVRRGANYRTLALLESAEMANGEDGNAVERFYSQWRSTDVWAQNIPDELFKRNERVYKHLREAAQSVYEASSEPCVVKPVISNDPGPYASLTYFLSLRAANRLGRGECDGALDDIADLVALSRVWTNGEVVPGTGSLSWELPALYDALDGILLFHRSGKATDEQLRRAIRLLDYFPQGREMLKDSLIAQYRIVDEAFEAALGWISPERPSQDALNKAHVENLFLTRQTLALVDKGYDDRTWDRLVELAEKMVNRHSGQDEGYKEFFINMNAFAKAAEQAAWYDFILASARVMLAEELYKRRTGSYSETLDQLVPNELKSVPIDPFGHGAPLKSFSEVVYSVGPKGDFDGVIGDYLHRYKEIFCEQAPGVGLVPFFFFDGRSVLDDMAEVLPHAKLEVEIARESVMEVDGKVVTNRVSYLKEEKCVAFGTKGWFFASGEPYLTDSLRGRAWPVGEVAHLSVKPSFPNKEGADLVVDVEFRSTFMSKGKYVNICPDFEDFIEEGVGMKLDETWTCRRPIKGHDGEFVTLTIEPTEVYYYNPAESAIGELIEKQRRKRI